MPSRSSAPGLKFSTSTSDLAISSLNSSLPLPVFKFSVRLRLLALNSRNKRLSLSWSRMFRRAMSPPFGSSSLITSAPRNPSICAQAGPAWLWVMSITRMPDSALSMLVLPNSRSGPSVASTVERHHDAVGGLESDQSEIAQADISAVADDQVIMYRNVENGRRLRNVLGGLDICRRRSWIAGRVIVHEDKRCGTQIESTPDHFAGADRRIADGSALLPLVLDQRVLAVEKKDVELLNLAVGDLRIAIIDQLVPGVDYRPVAQLRPQ